MDRKHGTKPCIYFRDPYKCSVMMTIMVYVRIFVPVMKSRSAGKPANPASLYTKLALWAELILTGCVG